MLLLALGTTARAQTTPPKEAEPATKAANSAVLRELNFADRRDFEDAQRGFVASLLGGRVASDGQPVWSMERYAFLQDRDAPPTVNPSLWRQAQLNSVHGLFKVADRVWQVRGLDLGNMTIVESDTGLIITDALLSAETARAALDLYYQHRPQRPITAVIYSHSHVDHYGGIKGIVSDDDVRQGKVKLIAPEGFMAEAVSENVIAGPAMARRAQYQFGPLLATGERGQVDTGLGKNLSRGRITLIEPNETITKNYETRVIDGIEIEFHLVPGSEAPSEMIMYYPQLRLLNMAEDTAHTLHNIYTIRGAQVRDGRLWSRYIGEALQRYGERTDVLIAQHHWPTWGRDNVGAFLRKQRDLYKYVHDQSVRLMNKGYTPGDIAERLKLPPSLASEWSARGYYGTLSHNSKGVYQYYLGWYDANPAHLHPPAPVDAARKAVDYMGGAEAVVKRARDDFRAGNYRWVASVMDQVVFADPGNRAARELGADALDQLGYQAEAATWRNAYLMGARELRGAPLPPQSPRAIADVMKALPLDMAFDSMAVRLDGFKANDRRITINWAFSDLARTYVLNLENSALTYTEGSAAERADATLTLTRATFDAITLREKTLSEVIRAGEVRVEGDATKIAELMTMLDDVGQAFQIVEPLADSRR